jgi:hypothetical protein
MKEPKPVGQILQGLSLAKETHTRIRQRQIDAAVLMGSPDDSPLSILYQHAVLCQVYLPYRDPGDETRRWSRSNGYVDLEVEAGRAHDGQRFVDVGLPFGPRSRVVMMHINQLALVSKSRVIVTDETLTQFVRSNLKLTTDGRTIRVIGAQLLRLSAASIRLGAASGGKATTVHSHPIKGFDMWHTKEGGQRALWPSTIELSADYHESLQAHAVPLDGRAIAALAHSALALDVYAWLAQRLHRVPKDRPAFVPWTALHEQFGLNYDRLRKFREVFKVALKQVAAEYSKARFELDGRGMLLRHSAPPIPYRSDYVVRAVDKPVKS